MKKIIKIISLSIILVMSLSMMAFAAEKETGSKIEMSDILIQTEDAGDEGAITPRIPAPPVTNIQISNAEIRNDGYVYVTVAITGYGKNNYCTWDGAQATLDSVGTDGKPIVEVNYLTYKCGYATVGTHQFYFRTTSINSPWNTESISTTFTIS